MSSVVNNSFRQVHKRRPFQKHTKLVPEYRSGIGNKNQ